MDKRPNLNKNISVKDFQDFYWLKKELTDFCRAAKIPTRGGKIEISERIIHYLKTGQVKKQQTKKKSNSKFDWNKALLSKETIITDNYKSSENVRDFFIQVIGPHFKFNVQFMNWMKSNAGKTLQDAAEQWYVLQKESNNKSQPKKIAPQFEYNTYLRDFLAHYPNQNRATGIACWKIKRDQRGHNRFEPKDLDLLK